MSLRYQHSPTTYLLCTFAQLLASCSSTSIKHLQFSQSSFPQSCRTGSSGSDGSCSSLHSSPNLIGALLVAEFLQFAADPSWSCALGCSHCLDLSAAGGNLRLQGALFTCARRRLALLLSPSDPPPLHSVKPLRCFCSLPLHHPKPLLRVPQRSAPRWPSSMARSLPVLAVWSSPVNRPVAIACGNWGSYHGDQPAPPPANRRHASSSSGAERSLVTIRIYIFVNSSFVQAKYECCASI